MAALTGSTLTTLNDNVLAARPDGVIEGWHRNPFLWDFVAEKCLLPMNERSKLFVKIASSGLAMTSGTNTELDTLTDSAISTDGTTITAAVVRASVPASLEALMWAKGREVVIQEMMPAAMERVNTDVLTLQNSFASTLSTTAMTAAIFRAGFFDFKAAKPVGEILVAAMRLEAFEQLVESLATTSAAITAAMAPWMAALAIPGAAGTVGGSYMGVQIFASASVPQKDANNWGTGFYAGTEYLMAPNAEGKSGLIGSTAKIVYATDEQGQFVRLAEADLLGGADGRLGRRFAPHMIYGTGLANDANGNSNGFLLETDK